VTIIDFLILWFIASIPASLLMGRFLRWCDTGE